MPNDFYIDDNFILGLCGQKGCQLASKHGKQGHPVTPLLYIFKNKGKYSLVHINYTCTSRRKQVIFLHYVLSVFITLDGLI